MSDNFVLDLCLNSSFSQSPHTYQQNPYQKKGKKKAKTTTSHQRSWRKTLNPKFCTITFGKVKAICFAGGIQEKKSWRKKKKGLKSSCKPSWWNSMR